VKFECIILRDRRVSEMLVNIHEISKSRKAHNSSKMKSRVTFLDYINHSVLRNKCVKFECIILRDSRVSEMLVNIHEISKSKKAHNSSKMKSRVAFLDYINHCVLRNKCVKFEANPLRDMEVIEMLQF